MSLNLPPRMQALLDALPPGANLFDYTQHVLDDEVFPSIPKAFWNQIWAAIVLLVLIILAFGAGFAVRIRRKRMKVIISDGQLTRPDPKLFVPILWTCVAICDIGLNLLVRSSVRQKHYPVVLGRFWMLLHLPLVVSYVLVGSNVVASTPAFRKYFINMHRGAWFNFGTIGLGLAMCAGIVAPSVTVGDALRRASDAYHSAAVIIQEAKSTGNIAQLLALQDILGDLEGAGRDHVTAIRDGNAIYAGYVAFFLLACIIPGISLNRYVNHKISRLEQNKNPYSSRSVAATESHKLAAVSLRSMQHDLPLHITAASRQDIPHTRLNFVPEQPKDRPFAQLVVVETPLLPARFNDILKDGTQSNSARILRLRRALRIDMRFLAAYTLQLCAFGGMTVFFCFSGDINITMRQHLTLSLAFPTWNFIASGLFVSAASLYDALIHEEAEEASHALPLGQIPGQTNSKLSTIQCSQVVDIAYVSERSEKRFKDIEEEELRIVGASKQGRSEV